MRVLLDTNVLLTGAFEPWSYARQLSVLRGAVAFVAPAAVRRECAVVIGRKLRRAEHRSAALLVLDDYARDLGLIWVDDAPKSSSPRRYSKDADDDAIIQAAHVLGCEAICTYNIRDFADSAVPLFTPLSLLRVNAVEPRLDYSIQTPRVGREGTLLVVGFFAHASAIGELIAFGDGSRLKATESGDFVLAGRAARPVKTLARIPAGELVAVVLRYEQQGELELSYWSDLSVPTTGVIGVPKQHMLARGKIADTSQARVLLCFDADHTFFTSVVGISAIPRYVRTKNMLPAIHAGSLEALYGSSELAMLRRV